MQETKYLNNSLPKESLKPIDLNNCFLNEIYQKNFLHGLQNARNLLASLEHSIEKSSKYEDRLLRCRSTHKHSHDFNDWSWGSDFSDDKDLKASKTNSGVTKPSQLQNSVNFIESWSTMSIVCLQYQYEELSKRYESLLKAFNDKCSIISAKKSTLARLRQRAKLMHAQLAAAHRALICVGEKYLTLKKRRHEQIKYYDRKILFLKSRVHEVVAAAEKARLQLDQKLAQCMAVEHTSEYALLLAEMRKCNQLFLENLKLKAHLEEFVPGTISLGN